MTQLLDTIYQMVIHPSTALYEITKEKTMKEPLIISIISIILLIISSFDKNSGLLGSILIILSIIINIALHSGAIHYISSLWGGSGKAIGITKGFIANTIIYGFCVFPMFFMAWGFETIARILFILIAIWGYVLDVIAIRENYGFTTNKSILIMLIPQIITIIIVAIFTVVLMLSAISGIMELQNIGTMINQI